MCTELVAHEDRITEAQLMDDDKLIDAQVRGTQQWNLSRALARIAELEARRRTGIELNGLQAELDRARAAVANWSNPVTLQRLQLLLALS